MPNQIINSECILHACTIQGDGSGQPLTGKDITQEIKSHDLAWVHLDATHPDTRKWLESEVSYLDPLILDALLADETRPRIVEYDNGMMMILRGMNLNEKAEPEDMVSIRIWVDESRIISLRRRRLKAVSDIRDLLENVTGPKDSGDFISMLSAKLFERMEPVLTELDEKLDDIEELILDNPEPSERQAITSLRKQAIIFRRYIAPQRDVMMHLRTSDQVWLSTAHKRRIQENLDRVTRYVEDLDSMRERAQVIKDELANALSDRLNKNLYILSVISAIFLPLGFFTGLMGINIGGMPGVDNNNAFWVFSALLITIVACQVLIFKKLKWF